MKTPDILIEVAFATTERSDRRQLQLPLGSTVRDAVVQCGLLAQYPEIDLNKNRVGIFGRLVSQTAILGDGDRVEIYRPLTTDPKEARRRRAAARRKQV